MSPSQPDPDGRKTRPPATRRYVRRAADDFDAASANIEMAQKLQRNSLRRRARVLGFELRQSAYGYSLVDAARKRVDDRSDFTLDEVAVRLDAASNEG
jgi:hypothetical protein